MKVDELIVGAALGLPFTVLYDAVKLAVKTNNEFKSLLESLNATMETINPLVKEAMEAVAQKRKEEPTKPSPHGSSGDAELPKEAAKLKQLMEKGEVLVKKCSQVRKWNLISKYSKSNKLRALDQEIRRFFGLEVPMRTLTTVNQMFDFLKKLKSDQDQCSKKKYVKVSKVYQSPEAPEFVVGLRGPFKELKEKLLQKGVSGHVISAPGGYGKTTLASELIHDADVKGTFKSNIFFMCVSESYNLTVMVQHMFSTIDKEKVPDIETDEEALLKLQELLTTIGKDPVLIVLDDVWSKSQELLDKFEFKNISYYKILVTSRYAAFKKFYHPHQLDGLNDVDALKLFLHSATPLDGSSKVLDGSLLHEIAEQIVEHCKGSPLALTVVGSSLGVCGMDLQQWQNKLRQLSEGSSSLVNTESKILHCLEKSLHDLSSTHYKLKECFLDMGLFPEDHQIPATIFIDIWDELYELGADGVHALAILHEVLNRNLVHLLCTREDNNVGDGFYGNLYVMQHDLLRQLAIYQNNQEPLEQRERIYLDIRKNKFPEWMNEEQKALKARAVSICTDSLFSSCWPDINTEQLPAVKVVILNFQTKKYSLPSFMAKMDKLKTLVVANNGFVTVEPSNLAIVASIPNLKKIRLERIKVVPFLSIHTAVFRNLEKISLFMCSSTIADLVGTEVQFCEAFPKLEEIDISYCTDLERLPDGICEVKSLRKISITDCHKLSELPSELGNLENLEVLRVSSCSSLERLPNSITELKNLRCLDISDCLRIQKFPEKFGELETLQVLQMNGCSGLQALSRSIINLGQLKRVICDEERAALWNQYKKRPDKLRVIVVEKEHNLNWLKKK